MHRTLVLALVVCALGVAVAVFVSLRSSAAQPSGAQRAPATASGGEAPAQSSEIARAAPDSLPVESATTRAASWPDANRGTFEILVVSDEDEQPIAGARVWGERGAPSEDLGSRLTGADGRASWTDLPRRALALEATAPGRTTASVKLEFDPILTAKPFVVRLPEQRDVRVRLVDARGMDATSASLGFEAFWSPNLLLGLAAACTTAGQAFDSRGAPTHRTQRDAVTDDALAWRVQIRGADPTCVHLLLGDVVLASKPLDPRATELAIPVARDDVHRALTPIVVRVLAEGTREPVPGAVIEIAPHPLEGARRTADGAGLVRIENALAGEFQLVVLAPGFAARSVRVRRPIAGEIEVLLKVGHDVDGVVLDVAGATKAGVVLVAYDAAEMGGTASALQTVTSDVTGRFAFQALPADEVVLVATIDEPAADPVFLPRRENLPPACHVVPCRGGAHDVVIRWMSTAPERGRAAGGNR